MYSGGMISKWNFCTGSASSYVPNENTVVNFFENQTSSGMYRRQGAHVPKDFLKRISIVVRGAVDLLNILACNAIVVNCRCIQVGWSDMDRVRSDAGYKW